MLDLQIFDSRHVWHEHALKAAHRRGWAAKRITTSPTEPSRFGFIRPHPGHLADHQQIDQAMREVCGTMVQDRKQVTLYENKTAQQQFFGHHMPETLSSGILDEAVAFATQQGYPIVSKANEGASSVNVRIIESEAQLQRHLRQVFSKTGIPVHRCADGMMTVQKDYVFLQRFIPHDRTYRVNIIGNRAAIFERYNYADKPVAQTGNTQGIHDYTELHESLLKYAFSVARDIGSKWVALDILRDHERGQWYLLETSLAWPWNPNDYSDVPFTGGGTWGAMWDVLYDQLESGVFASTSR
jgi:glutathione synthase/RimK-type ligase-like ATP-grasp enzyme